MKRTLLAAALLVACLFSSCAGVAPTMQPSELWVRASRANFDVLAPKLAGYLKADATLLPTQRDVLLRMLSDWDYLIRQGEAAWGGVDPGPAPDSPYATPTDAPTSSSSSSGEGGESE